MNVTLPASQPHSAPTKAIQQEKPDAEGIRDKVAGNEAIKVDAPSKADTASREKNRLIIEQSEGSSSITSFTYGALGMDHPDTVEVQEDEAYNAGQFMSALSTVGTILSILV